MPDATWVWLIGGVVVIGFFLVKGISAGIDLKEKLVGDREPKANPPFHLQFTPRVEHEVLRTRVDSHERQLASVQSEIRDGFAGMAAELSKSRGNLHQKIEEQAKDSRQELKEEMGGVHDRINDVLRAVSKQEGINETLTKKGKTGG